LSYNGVKSGFEFTKIRVQDKPSQNFTTASVKENYIKKKVKGKFYTIAGHEASEGEKRHSSTLSLTSVLDCGGWSKPHSGRFTPRKRPGVHLAEAR